MESTRGPLMLVFQRHGMAGLRRWDCSNVVAAIGPKLIMAKKDPIGCGTILDRLCSGRGTAARVKEAEVAKIDGDRGGLLIKLPARKLFFQICNSLRQSSVTLSSPPIFVSGPWVLH